MKTTALNHDVQHIGIFIRCARVLCCLVLISSLDGATISWDAGGSTDVWNVAENWSDDAAVSASNDYVVSGSGNVVQSIDANTSSFAGGSLEVSNGAVLRLFRTNGGTALTASHAITNLVVEDASVQFHSSLGSVTHLLSNPVTFLGTVAISGDTGSYTNQLTLNGVSGSGQVNLTRNANGGAARNLNLNGLSTYTGDWNASGSMSSSEVFAINLNHASGWGTGELTLGNFAVLNFNTEVDQMYAELLVAGTSGVAVNLGTGSSTLGHLTWNGVEVLADTYTAEELNIYLGVTAFTGTGTITVVAPEPAMPLLMMLGTVAWVVRRPRPNALPLA